MSDPEGVDRKKFGRGWILGKIALNLVLFHTVKVFNSNKFIWGFEPAKPAKYAHGHTGGDYTLFQTRLNITCRP